MGDRERHGAAARSALLTLGLATTVLLVGAGRTNAKGGSSVSVTTTGIVNGTLVSGAVTMTNAGATGERIQSVSESLEVRFPSGVTPPPLPAGSTSGWYTVATAPVSAPVALPANGAVNAPYVVDPCAAGAKNYRGAKDMRSVARVTLATQSIVATSLNYALPSKCAVCGNGIVEAGEQCDGGACCTTACQYAPAGAACNDGNACTQTDRCQAGMCVGSQPVGCIASDQCHAAGACNPATGACSNPANANGTPCDDGNACTQTDTCQSGLCSGGNPVVCTAADQCHVGQCDRQTGHCASASKADGTECADGNVCTVADACQGGACVSGEPRNCNDHMTCTDDACDDTNGCAHAPSATCGACDSQECVACDDACDASHDQCLASCWSTFWGCLNLCTSTYCAPFCQQDLSRCLAACPAPEPCRSACDTGNGCAADCSPAPF